MLEEVQMVAAVIAASAALVVCFFAYLAMCAFIVMRTNGTAGLRDLAVAMRAFGRGPFGLGRRSR